MPVKPPDKIDSLASNSKPKKKPTPAKKPPDKDEDAIKPKRKPVVKKKPAIVKKKPAPAPVSEVNNVIKLEIQGVKMEIALNPGQGLASAKITESPAKPKNKKKTIPKCVKIDCWNHWIGKAVGESKCLCCGIREIGQNNFECGHIVSEAKGGGTTIDNLKPICGVCNKSMQTMNMDDFKKAHYPGDKKQAAKSKKKPEPGSVDKLESGNK